MWSAILGLAGTAASGIMSAINNRKAKQEQDAEAARQEAYYTAKANENPLARSENQQLLGQYDRQAQQQIENARGVAAITGATPEYGLAVQKSVAEGRANLMGNMAAGASARKDQFESAAEGVRHQHSMDEIARRQQRNETFAALAGNAANMVGSLAGASLKKTPSDLNAELDELNKSFSNGLISQEIYDAQKAKISTAMGKYYGK